jgi:hypothetical protein
MKVPRVHNYRPTVSKPQRIRNCDPPARNMREILYERESQRNVFYLDRNAAVFATTTPYQSHVRVEKVRSMVLKSFELFKMPEKIVACRFLCP